ncbi:hypothetical protein SA496_14435 [Pseudomonas sp. JS3066]|uniref:hypothetical protein n=1 Tax=Pseudomonas sp. JS3066 TaxID=3090665 RepID=UPI002E7C236A|nr:hypothetical protein [Pseudomonas sp. JS3066]WVK90943.1 hypothetical protein SA496_14435 [Pseudomonas sp. JS3066]
MSGNGGDGGGDIIWPWSKIGGDDFTPWPASLLADAPTLIKDLKGRKCRVVCVGDRVDQGSEPGRVTIFLKDGRIADIVLEPGLPTE